MVPNGVDALGSPELIVHNRLSSGFGAAGRANASGTSGFRATGSQKSSGRAAAGNNKHTINQFGFETRAGRRAARARSSNDDDVGPSISGPMFFACAAPSVKHVSFDLNAIKTLEYPFDDESRLQEMIDYNNQNQCDIIFGETPARRGAHST